MDITIIKTALDAAKGAFSAAKVIQQLSKDTAVNAAVIEIQQSLLSLQEMMLSAQEQILGLMGERDSARRELAESRGWEDTQSRFELFVPIEGTMVYRLKAVHAAVEPMHYLCPICFEKKVKVILQMPSPANLIYGCKACEAEFWFHPPPDYNYASFSGSY